MPRWINPHLEPALVGTVAATVYAAGVMAYRALTHQGVFDMDVAVAGVMALYGLYTRMKVTPLAQPKDYDKQPLVPVQPPSQM